LQCYAKHREKSLKIPHYQCRSIKPLRLSDGVGVPVPSKRICMLFLLSVLLVFKQTDNFQSVAYRNMLQSLLLLKKANSKYAVRWLVIAIKIPLDLEINLSVTGVAK
jgi:hypothetical protein